MQGGKKELADADAEQVRGDGCGKPGTAGSPGRREEGGLQRCWGQLVEGGKRTASENI